MSATDVKSFISLLDAPVERRPRPAEDEQLVGQATARPNRRFFGLGRADEEGPVQPGDGRLSRDNRALLQEALSSGAGNRLVFYAFDLLHLDGWNIRAAPLERRKALLSSLLSGHTGSRSAIQFSDHFAGDGMALFEQASERGLEGVVSKRASSPRVNRSTAT